MRELCQLLGWEAELDALIEEGRQRWQLARDAAAKGIEAAPTEGTVASSAAGDAGKPAATPELELSLK